MYLHCTYTHVYRHIHVHVRTYMCIVHNVHVHVLPMLCVTRAVCFVLQELSPTSDANLTHSLMNIHESLLDEFKDESKFTQLALTDEQKEAWVMVSRHCSEM